MRLILQDLDKRIDALDDAAFQLLGERFLRLAYHERFARLVPHGRNPAGRTVRGWPDGYWFEGGRAALFEATRSTKWRTHLRNDIASLEQAPPGSVRDLFFIAWAREPSISDAQALEGQIAAAGVPDEGIHLIFRGELVERLSQSTFAALRYEALGVPTSAEPFVLIEDAAVFGTGVGDEFAPSRHEYDRGEVDVPGVRSRVDAALRDAGFAYLRGRGASGKTTLAVQLALEARKQDRPAYYWDVSEVEESRIRSLSDILDIFATRAGDGVLFVVDNVHQNQDLAARLHAHWRTIASKAQLLFVGREVIRRARAGRTPPLRSLEDADLVLAAGAAEILGVLRRLARRAGATVADPPEEELERLSRSFGGDLVALSAAVAPKLHSGTREWPRVEPADARRHVTQRYLAGLDVEARRELLVVCALSWLELGTSEDIAAVDRLDQALSQGAVQDVVGTGGRRYLRTAHPGLGDLIGRAGSATGEHEPALMDAVERRPALAALVAQRLVELDETSMALELLRAVTTSDDKLALYLIGRVGELSDARYDELASRALINPEDADAALAPRAAQLASALQQAELRHAIRTLKWLERTLPGSYAAVRELLLREDRLREMATSLASEPLGALARVNQLEHHLPSIGPLVMRELVQRQDRAAELVVWLATGPPSKRKSIAAMLSQLDRVDSVLDAHVTQQGIALLGAELPLERLTKKRKKNWESIRVLDGFARSEDGRAALISRAQRSPKDLADVLRYRANR